MGYAEGSLFYYAPNHGAPIAFAVMFFISGCVHLYECIRFKCFKAATLLIWAPILFVAGFILRTILSWNYSNLPLFIAETVLLLVAPPVYEGANYIILGRILYYIPYLSPLHPGRVITTFLALDTVVGILTANGGSRLSDTTNTSSRHIGEALLKASLILQLFCMACFLAIAGYFDRKVTKEGLMRPNLRKPLLMLYTSCVLITIRTIYRTVEYFATTSSLEQVYSGQVTAESQLSPLFRYEWFFYVFEASLMITNSVLLNIFHPMRYLPRNNKIYLDREGVEIEGPGYKDNRHFLMTIIDPFDVVGIIKGRDKEERFWETRGEVKPTRGGEETVVASPTPNEESKV